MCTCVCFGVNVLPDGEEVCWQRDALVVSSAVGGGDDRGLDDETLERTQERFIQTNLHIWLS